MNSKSEEASQHRLIFACSGAADVGQLADLAARKLTQEGCGRLFCLASVGGRVATMLETVRSATRILAIDGCREECARKTLEQAGFARIRHIQLEDLGFRKGRTPPTAERIEIISENAAALLT